MHDLICDLKKFIEQEYPKKIPLPIPSKKAAPQQEISAPKVEKKVEILSSVAKPRQIIDGLQEMKQVVHAYCTLLEEIPSDLVAKRHKGVQEGKAASVAILSFQESLAPRSFLEAIAKALTAYGYPAELVSSSYGEKLLHNPDVKLFIANEYALQSSKLAKFYKESMKQGRWFLADTPLFLLADPSLYFTQPQLKASLWRSLLATLR